MTKIYYEKVGRRYKPVSEYDPTWMDSFGKGNHLVMCYPGGQSRVYNVDPNRVALIAAGRTAHEKMREAIYQAASMNRMKHEETALTREQIAAWRKFEKVMGERGKYIQYNSCHDIADAGLKVLEDEAEKLMSHPAVKDAYEQFLLVCKMTKEKQNDSP